MELCIEQETASVWQETKWEQGRLPGLELPAVETLEAPADLRSWVCPATVLAWVAHEVEAGHCRDVQPAGEVGRCPAFQRKIMLCVLAYSYATQMFDDEEIARACATEPALRWLCGGRAPFPAELQRFRRSNRAALESIVARVLERGIRHRFDLGGMLLPVELDADLHRLATERLDIARHMEPVESD